MQDDSAAATAIDINTSGFAGIFLLSVCLIGKHKVTISSKKIPASEMPDTVGPNDTAFVAIPKKYQGELSAEVKSSANEINSELESK